MLIPEHLEQSRLELVLAEIEVPLWVPVFLDLNDRINLDLFEEIEIFLFIKLLMRFLFFRRRVFDLFGILIEGFW